MDEEREPDALPAVVPAEKEAMPRVLVDAAAKAQRKHRDRWPAPPIDIVEDGEGWWFQSPYQEEQEWWQLLGEAFGTRSQAVIGVFMSQLAQLVDTVWIGGEPGTSGKRRPEETELMAAISIVASLKPKNEAEAGFAASIVATHFAAMKMGAEVARRSYPDSRTVASLAAINRTYAQQMATFQALRGGRRGSRQTIIVKKENHVHYTDARSVNVPGGGGGKSGGQAHEAEPERARASRAFEPVERPALPRPNEGGDVVQFPGGEGPQPLPPSRGRQGVGSAEG
jgi:hypothetical protein